MAVQGRGAVEEEKPLSLTKLGFFNKLHLETEPCTVQVRTGERRWRRTGTREREEGRGARSESGSGSPSPLQML